MIKEPSLFKEYVRLANASSLEEITEQYKLVTDSCVALIKESKPNREDAQWKGEAHLLFQMASTKCFSVLRLSEGVSHDGFVSVPNYFDPFAVWPIIRSQFESYCLFNNIYVCSSSENETLFKYNLWVLSGLNYRQANASDDLSDENREKQITEAALIESIKSEIFNNPFLTELGEQEIQKTERFISAKKFQVFKNQNNKLVNGAWHELLSNSGAKDMFKKLYALMSLATHPSNVSVFQYRDMFNGDNAKQNMYYALKFSSIIISGLISDYCVYRNHLKETFNDLPKINQLIVNTNNITFRSEENRINDLNNDLWGDVTVEEAQLFLRGNK